MPVTAIKSGLNATPNHKGAVTHSSPLSKKPVTERLIDESMTKHNGDREKVCKELQITSDSLNRRLDYYRMLDRKWGKHNG